LHEKKVIIEKHIKEGKMKRIKFLTGLIMVIIITVQLTSCRRSNDVSKDTWTECPVTCDWTEGKVVFLRKHIHPIMAEYKRKFRLDIVDQNSVYCPLPVNGGGRTLINVYWIEEKDGFGPMLLLREYMGEHLIDLKNKKTLELIKRESDRLFIGEYTTEDSSFGWSYNPEGELTVHVGRKVATEISHDKIYDRSKYIGRIDGRKPGLYFIPSSDSKEETIRMFQY
jgi:hypothetical protein